MLRRLFSSRLAIVGLVLTTLSGTLLLTFLALELTGHLGGPYVGLLAWVATPAIFVLGLVLMPLGTWRRRPAGPAPIIDLNQPRTQALVFACLGLSVVNVGLLATGTVEGVHAMESDAFCGGACHQVMAPEALAHRAGAHAEVACTTCHVGPGAGAFVRAKLAGAAQLAAMVSGTYERPISTPLHGAPTSQTCTGCHATERPEPDRLRVVQRHESDEANTPKVWVLNLKVHALHWHRREPGAVRFAADPSRQHVFALARTRPDGGLERWSEDGSADAGLPLEVSCLDCHNRPAHTFSRADDAVDGALLAGTLDARVPWLRKASLEALQTPLGAPAKRAALSAFYADAGLDAPDDATLEASAAVLAGLEAQNVFPQMRVGWGTYPTNDAHREDTSGCFRCHRPELKTAAGKKMTQACDLCHVVLVDGEADPELLHSLRGE